MSHFSSVELVLSSHGHDMNSSALESTWLRIDHTQNAIVVKLKQ